MVNDVNRADADATVAQLNALSGTCAVHGMGCAFRFFVHRPVGIMRWTSMGGVAPCSTPRFFILHGFIYAQLQWQEGSAS